LVVVALPLVLMSPPPEPFAAAGKNNVMEPAVEDAAPVVNLNVPTSHEKPLAPDGTPLPLEGPKTAAFEKLRGENTCDATVPPKSRIPSAVELATLFVVLAAVAEFVLPRSLTLTLGFAAVLASAPPALNGGKYWKFVEPVTAPIPVPVAKAEAAVVMSEMPRSETSLRPFIVAGLPPLTVAKTSTKYVCPAEPGRRVAVVAPAIVGLAPAFVSNRKSIVTD